MSASQIQDLRNYADINSRASNLAHPPVPEWYAWPSLNPVTAAHNFDTFFRKGIAPTWNQMGNGNHANVAELRVGGHQHVQSMLTFNGLPAGGRSRRPSRSATSRSSSACRTASGSRVGRSTRRASNPTAVDVYVNGAGFARLMANDYRPDVQRGVLRGRTEPRVQHDPADPRRQGVPVRDQHRCRRSRTRRSDAGRVPGPEPVGRHRLHQPPARTVCTCAAGWSIPTPPARPTSTSGRTASASPASRPTAPGPTSVPRSRATAPRTASTRSCPGVGGNVCVYAINVGAGNGTRSSACRKLPRAEPDREPGHRDPAVRRRPGPRAGPSMPTRRAP